MDDLLEIESRIYHIKEVLARSSEPGHELREVIEKFYCESLRREENKRLEILSYQKRNN